MRGRGLLTGVVVALAIAIMAPQAAATFPGDNGDIVLQYFPASGRRMGLATVTSDGSDLTRLTRNDRYTLDEDPAYSPDGSRIAFARGRDIWIMDVDGSDARKLVGGRTGEFCPSWGPDGDTVAYTRGGDLWTTSVAVPRPRRIVRTEAVDEYCPSWSPDGSAIAYAHRRRRAGGGDWDIALMAPDGSDRRRLTSGPVTEFAPDWSPDGAGLVFEAYDQFGSPTIVTIDSTGSSRTVVFDGKRQGAWGPTFSPDGASIAFWRNSLSGDVWVVGSDGSDPHRITSGPGAFRQPAWRPLP